MDNYTENLHPVENETKVGQMFVYPLKGAQGIPVSELILINGELQNDRIFSIAREDKNRLGELHIVNSRNIPQISSLHVRPAEDGFCISSDRLNETIYLSYPTVGNIGEYRYTNARIKDHNGLVSLPFEHYNEWLGEALGMNGLHIVIPHDNWRRQYDPRYQFADARGRIAFSDNTPIHIISEDDLALFGQEDTIDLQIFRPNLTISGASLADYFSEGLDDLVQIRYCRIDNSQYRIAPCQRCVVINQNPKTGEKEYNNLKLLSSYKVSFGCYLLPTDGSPISTKIDSNSRIELF